MSGLSKDLGKKLVLTAEVAPPRGPDVSAFAKELAEIKKVGKDISAVNVVDLPSAMLLMNSFAGCLMVQKAGLEPIYQLTCRDRNMLALQSDLLAASAFSIDNVLSISGDHPSVPLGDHPNAKPVYDLDSSSLIKAMSSLNMGVDIMGQKINKKTNFFIGAAIGPGATPIDGEIYKTKRKFEAGADFFQTQAVFEPSPVSKFLDKFEKTFGQDIRKKVLVGVVLIHSVGMAKFLSHMPGLNLPAEVISKMEKAKDKVGAGVEIASEVIEDLKTLDVGGIHLMPAGKTDVLVRLLESL
ncbi:MAG: methylenetetrahydrofolate reductase [Candidatus Altiarchaeota archaeon]